MEHHIEGVSEAIDLLGEEFPKLNWNFVPDIARGPGELVSQWLGPEDEEVMLCAFKGKEIHEQFHRQDFFFLNFAFQGDYQALSVKSSLTIDVHEGDCYIGQPSSGYALRGQSDDDIVILGILIRRQTFFNEYLTPLSAEPRLLRFFLGPQVNRFSDEFIHLSLQEDSPIWALLDIMLVEYAHTQEDTQKILKPLIFSLIMLLTRAFGEQRTPEEPLSAAGEMVSWIEANLDGATLTGLANHLGYHPNYVSSLLHRETGHTFSEILLEKRMRRASLLLENTSLSQEQIAGMVGYRNTSNFYKAFRAYFGTSPKIWKSQSH